MSEFVLSGRAVDVVLAVIALEYVWLVARGRSPLAVALALIPGALMLLALKAALGDWSWMWIAGGLAASGLVHAADLKRRGWM